MASQESTGTALGQRLGQLLAGFSATLLVVFLPFVAASALTGWNGVVPGVGHLPTHWRLALVAVLENLLVVLFVAFCAAYFIRLLFWLRESIPRHWKRQTPPFEETPSKPDTDTLTEPVPELFAQAERRSVLWLCYGVTFVVVVLAGLTVLSVGLNVTGISASAERSIDAGVTDGGVLAGLASALSVLPLIAELSAVAGVLPGDRIVEQVVYNGTAALFAIAIRNLAYMFEHLTYISGQSSFRRPNRFTIYLIFGTTALATTLVCSLSVLVHQLASLG